MTSALPPTTDPAGLRLAVTVSLLNGLGYGLVFPVAAFAAAELGLSPAQATVVVGLHPVARLVAGPLWGRAADRWGRRPVLLAGTALAVAGHAVFAGAPGVGGLVVARLLTGLGAGDTVAAAAVAADGTAPGDRASALGLLRAAQGLGMLLGPVVGGALGLLSLRLPAAFAALASLGALGAALRWRPVGARASGAAAPLRWGWLVAASASAAAMASAEAVVPFAVRDALVPSLGWSTDGEATAIGLLVAILVGFGVSLAATDVLLSGRWVGRFGPRTVAVGALVAWAAVFAVTPPVYGWGLLPGAVAVVGAAVPAALAGTALATGISRSAPPDAQGAALGALAGAVALGEAIGPLAAGALYEVALGVPYRVGAAVLVAAAVVAWRSSASPHASASGVR